MLDPDLRIRPFRIQDQAAARALILNGLAEHFGVIDERFTCDLNDITASYLGLGHVFLVVEQQHTLVGTGALLVHSPTTGQIVRVSTHHAYRRRGIAHALCQQLLDHARQRGLRRVVVETGREWHEAIRLYHHLGFQPDAGAGGSRYFAMDLS